MAIYVLYLDRSHACATTRCPVPVKLNQIPLYLLGAKAGRQSLPTPQSLVANELLNVMGTGLDPITIGFAFIHKSFAGATGTEKIETSILLEFGG